MLTEHCLKVLLRFQLYYYNNNVIHGIKETLLIIDTRERSNRDIEDLDDDLDDEELKDPLEKAVQSK